MSSKYFPTPATNYTVRVPFDPQGRTPDQVAYEQIQDLLQGRSVDEAQYITIDGQQIQSITIEDLTRLSSYFAKRLRIALVTGGNLKNVEGDL